MRVNEEERETRFDALFREHYADIVAYSSWRAQSAADAQDVVAEVFLTAWRRLDEMPIGEAARPWLYVVARRVMAHQVRASRRRARLHQRLGSFPVAPVSDSTAEYETSALVGEALRRLKPADQEVLLLAEWEELTPTEIAQVLRRPVVTVRGRLHRARKRFRAAFEALQTAESDAEGQAGELPAAQVRPVASAGVVVSPCSSR